MSKGSANQQVLIDVQAEAKAAGAEDVQAMADAILSVGGAANLSAEAMDYLIAMLDTLRNSKGTAVFAEITRQANASAKAFKTLFETSQGKRNTKNVKNAYIQNTDTFLGSVGQIKMMNNMPVTAREKQAYQRLTESFENASAFIDMMGKEADDIAKNLKASGQNTVDNMYKLAESLEFFRRYVNQFDINRARNANTRRTERTNAREQAIEDRIKNNGNWDAYLDIKSRNRVRGEYVKEIAYKRAERNALRKNNYGTGLGEGIRQGLLNNEEMLLRSGGIKGFAARMGGTLLQNTKLGNAFSGGITGAGINLGAFAGAGVVAAVGALGKGIWELSKASVAAYENIEKVKTNLGVVYGTQGEADSVFSEISKYAIKSPFGVKDVAEQATILKQSGVAEYELMPMLKNLGDLAGGNTEKMNRLANAVSQIAASGTATQRQLRMFTMAGVPIYQSIADVKGINKSDVLGEVKKGNVSYDDIVKALEKLTQEGGPFYKAVEKGARTLSARKQNLADIKELALAETAQAKNLGFADFAGFAKWWTGFQEDMWQGAYDNRKNKRISVTTEEAEKTEEKLDQIDKMIASTNPQDVQQLNYLRVVRMEVENMATMSKDQREAALSEGYIYQNEKLLNAQYALLEASNLEGRLNSSTGSVEKEAIANYLESLGVSVKKTYAGQTSTGEKYNHYELDYSKLEKVIKEATKEYKALSPRAQEAALNVTNRALFKEVAQRPLGKQGQSTLDYVKGLYENSVQAKEEQKRQEEEKKKELQDIYDQMKEMGLSDTNKFGFMNKPMSAGEAVSLVSKYTYNTGESLDLDKNSEKFKESFATLTENIEKLGPAFLNGVGENNRAFKDAQSLLKNMVDPKKTKDIQTNIQNFEKLVKSLNGPAKELGLMMLQSRAHLDIDEKYLNFEEKGKKEKHNYAFDKSYAPLIRELTEQYLGVSLYRTIGADLGAIRGDPNRGVGVSETLGYMNNKLDRQMTAVISNALLRQTKGNKVDWFTISSMIKQSDAQKYKGNKSSYFDKDGTLKSGESTGRFSKAFVDYVPTRKEMMAYALKNGTGETIQSISEEYQKTLNSLNEFFTSSFTSAESKDANTRLLELSYEMEVLKRKTVGPDEVSAYNKRYDALKDEYDQLKETGPLAQMGVLETPEYRESVTALAHWMTEAAGGTKQYAEVMLDAIRIKKEDIEKTASVVSAIANLKTAIDEFDERIRKSKANTTVVMSSGNDERNDVWLQKIAEFVSDPKNFNYLQGLYKGKNEQEILNEVIKLANKGKDVNNPNYSIADWLTEQENVAKDTLGIRAMLGTREQFMKNNYAGGSYGYSAGKSLAKDTGVIIGNEEYKKLAKQALKEIGLDENFDLSNFSKQEMSKYGATNDYEAAGMSLQQLEDKRGEFYDAMLKLAGVENEVLSQEEVIAKGVLALQNDASDIKTKGLKTISEEDKTKWATKEREMNFENSRWHNATGVSLLNGDSDFMLFGGNTSHQQKILTALGVREGTSWNDYAAAMTGFEKTEEGYKITDSAAYTKFLRDRKEKGLSIDSLPYAGEFNRALEENNPEIFADAFNVDQIFSEDAFKNVIDFKEELNGITTTETKINKMGIDLSKTMLKAFDSAIVDGISQSMVKMGEAVRDSVDASEDIGKNLKNIYADMLKNLGPQVTQTGLSIASAAAQEEDWGKVAAGLALAAGGGIMSFTGGLLGESKDNSDDKDKQKEERLKTLADLLSDLIAQAKVDAEYYERNSRHRQSIQEDYGVSSKSVNDMIITPQGNFSTHPDDYIIATKTPNELGGKGSPNVTITIVNQSGDVVKVASTEKREKENGDLDIKATIIAVTADAVVNGELDGAFAQMQARQQGVSRTY